MDEVETRFENRLLAELVPLVGTMPPTAPAASPPRRRDRTGQSVAGLPPRPRSRRIAVLGGLVLILVIGVAAAVAVWPHRLATTAYALEQLPDGTLVVTVNDLSDPGGLQRALAEHHVRAAVLTVDPAVPCSEQARSVPAPGAVQGRPDRLNELLIRPALLPAGGTLLLGLSGVPAAGGADGGQAGAGGRDGGPGSRSGNPGGAGPAATGPASTAAAPGHDVTVYVTVVRGPAPRCFPGVVPALPAPTS